MPYIIISILYLILIQKLLKKNLILIFYLFIFNKKSLIKVKIFD